MRTLALLIGTVLVAGSGAAGYFLYRDRAGAAAPVLPPEERLDERALQADHQKLAFRPFDIPRLAFTMWVPKGWEATPLDTSPTAVAPGQNQEVLLAEIAPPGKEDTLLQVGYVEPPTGVPLEKALQSIVEFSTFEFVRIFGSEGQKDTRRTLSQQLELRQGRQAAKALIEVNNQHLGLMMEQFYVFRRGEGMIVIKGICPSGKYLELQRDFDVASKTISFDEGG